MARWMGSGGTAPVTVNCERHAREPVRLLLSALGDESDLQSAEIVPALPEHVDDVHRHAAGQRKAERLHGRRSFNRRAVERHARLAGRSAQHEIVLPQELHDRRRLHADAF